MGFGFVGVFGLMFVAILVLFIVTIAKGIGQWAHNNNQPLIERYCTVVAKRATTDAQHYNDANGHMQTTHSTTHYITFQFSDGNREEFSVSGREYGMHVEGDRGMLTSQGTRYKGFERSR